MSARVAMLVVAAALCAPRAAAMCVNAARADLGYCSVLVPAGGSSAIVGSYFSSLAAMAATAGSGAKNFTSPLPLIATSTACQAAAAVFFCQVQAGPASGLPASGA